jgi:uncharacterized membrane protein
MIEWTHPEGWLLLPVWLLAARLHPAWGLLRPLRAAMGLLLLLLWVEPRLPRQERGLDLWALIDHSASASAWLGPRQHELETLLERGRGPHDRLHLLDFAEEVTPRESAAASAHLSAREGTRIASAVHYALSRASPRRASRLLLISDGYSTEPLDEAGERLLESGIALDLRLGGGPSAQDAQVDALRAPTVSQPGEPVLLEAHLSGPVGAEIPYTLLRDRTVLARATARLADGRARLRWTDLPPAAGAFAYRLEIAPPADPLPGNNHATAWVDVRGGPRLLLVTGYRDDPLAGLLRAQGFAVEVHEEARDLHPGRLAGARAVLLNNLPAGRLPPEVLAALPFFVSGQGGGLLMIGGRHSFASGGYFESPLDPLLPVSMELKQEHRKLAVAMAIVLDRSGSMTAGVEGGLTKMDLANQGSARAIELLGDHDAVTVFAVDSSPHEIVPLTTLGEQRGKVLSLVQRIQSAGGGIYVYVGLQAAWQELKKSAQGQRHVILFSDAADSEEPGEYVALLEEMTRAGATVSVIALGREQDSDAALLEDIARRGNGRIFFNADAATLPALFAQETVAVSRSAFLEETTPTRTAAGWVEIAARDLAWLPGVDGYNLCYLRDGASASLLTADAYDAPLVAHWTRGVGRVAAVTFPLGGDFSSSARSWPQVGDFTQTLVRWLMGDPLPPGTALRSRVEGDTLRLDLLHDETWAERVARHPPRLVIQSGRSEAGTEHLWRRLEPGRFSARLPLAAGDVLRGAVQMGPHTLPLGPLAAAANPEWRWEPGRLRELRALSSASGGRERVDLAGVWESPPRLASRDWRGGWLVLLILLFLVDALLTRLGGQRLTWAVPQRPRRVAAAPKAPNRPAPVEPAAPEPSPVSAPPEPDPAAARRRLFEQARRRR